MKIKLFVGNSGFTMFECLAVILIMGLLLAVGVPSYETIVSKNAAFSAASRLVESMRLAQAEAIKRGLPITVCPISSSFNPTEAFNEEEEQWPCLNTNQWDAWKIFIDPNFDAEEDFSAGWPIIEYVRNSGTGMITSNIAGPIIYDPMGFANINPSTTRSGWTWSSSYSSGDWSWSYGYSSEYAGTYYRAFTVIPPNCTDPNARLIEINQNGLITVNETDCDGF